MDLLKVKRPLEENNFRSYFDFMTAARRYVGTVVGIPMQPPVAEKTREIPAGVVTFGVEYRTLDPESLERSYSTEEAHLAELRATSPPGGFSDRGVSIHVRGTADGHEYLRFDVFDDNPHYHYAHPAAPGEPVVNNFVDFDAVALGDMLPWAIDRLRMRLAPMLTEAGGGHLVARLDHERIASAIDEVQPLAERANLSAGGPER